MQSVLARTHFDAVSASATFGAEVQQLPVRVLVQLLEHAGLQTASEAPVLRARPHMSLHRPLAAASSLPSACAHCGCCRGDPVS